MKIRTAVMERLLPIWGENRLLSKKDGYVELSDKSVLRIGNIHQPDQMVLLLYKGFWKKPKVEKAGVWITAYIDWTRRQ